MSNFEGEKTLSAILFLAQKKGRIDLYALLKVLYYADKEHFQKWGRTITRDSHCRLPYGPVPSHAYDMLKSVRGDGYWYQDLSSFFRFETDIIIVPLQKPDMSLLSASDIEALEKSFKERGDKDFNALMEEAHSDAVFNLSKEREMTEEDLAEGDPILIKHLSEIRENEEFLERWRSLAPIDEEGSCKKTA